MGNRPISYQDVALQIFYASIFYPFANFRQLANSMADSLFCAVAAVFVLYMHATMIYYKFVNGSDGIEA